MEKKWVCTVCGYMHEDERPPGTCPSCGAFMYQFILYEKVPEDLEKSLKQGLAGESKAYMRNSAFARKAEKDGFDQIAKLFRAVAEAEKIHAAEYLRYLEGVVGDTEENLKVAFENEIKANTQIYPPLIKQAMALGREDVAWSFIRAKDVEERHSVLYKEALNAMVAEQEPDYYVCGVCGYVFNRELPEECPVCKSKKQTFRRIT
ncbi:rubrerythrin family protein [Candidatus Poribacteria bacterium]|nr:rubrerythrin family protein [Candidatus Poribacteria bacterium]